MLGMKMIKANDQVHNRFKPWQRAVSLLSVFFFLMSTPIGVLAATLTNDVIETYMRYSHEFQFLDDDGAYQYSEASYIDFDDSSQVTTMEQFYRLLIENSPGNVEEPTSVPTSGGTTTTNIPVYKTYKYIGTPFVQVRLVREQINELLNRNLIYGDPANTLYSSEYAQLQSLYNNAYTYALSQINLKFGQPLDITPETTPMNMVWPEVRTINGEEVLVPVVYLTASTIEDRKIITNTTEFYGAVNFENVTIENATVKLGRDAFLKAAKDLTVANGGSVESDESLNLEVGGALTLLSGHLNSNGDVKIGAGSVSAQTIVHRYDYGYEQGGNYGEISSVSANGDVLVRSYSDIELYGALVDSSGGITFAADGNIYIGTQQIVTQGEYRGRWNGSYVSVDYLGSKLSAEDSIKLIANGMITVDASEIVSSQGHVEILAGLGVTIDSELKTYQSSKVGEFKKRTINESIYQTVAIRSLLDAGKTVRLHSEFGDITLRSVDLKSEQGTNVNAASGGVNLLLTTETDHYAYSSVKENTFTVSTRSYGHNIETGVQNTIVGGLSVEALGKVNVEYVGIDLKNPMYASGSKLDAQVNEFRNIEGLNWIGDLRDNPNLDIDWTKVNLDYETWSERTKSLNAAAMAVITIAVAIATSGAGAGLVGAASGTTQAAIANAALTSIVNTAAIASANAMVNGGSLLDMQKAAFEAVLSDDGLKSVATAVITAGVIAELDAAFFEVDSNSIKVAADAARETATSAGSTAAEIQAAVDAAIDGATLSLSAQVTQAATHAAVKAGVNTVVNGGDFGDFGDSFSSLLLQSAIDRIGQEMATEIGQSFKVGDINNVTRYIAHAATGCVIGAATAGVNGSQESASTNCATGLGGAVVGEFIGDVYKSTAEHADEIAELEAWLAERGVIGEEDFYSLTDEEKAQLYIRVANTGMDAHTFREFRQNGIDAAKLGAALTALVSGVDVQIAALTATNAVENNGLPVVAYLAYIWLAANVTLTVVDVYDKVQAVDKLNEDLKAAETQEEKDAILRDFALDIGIDISVDVIVTATGTKLLKAIADAARKTGKASDSVVDELEKLGDSLADDADYKPEIEVPTNSNRYDVAKVKEQPDEFLSAADQERILEIRESLGLTSNRQLGRNVAFGEGHIDGKDIGEMIGVSGARPPGLDMPEDRLFSTFEVGHPRDLDSEVFILENLARKLTPESVGSFRLVSERTYCDSCDNVIKQFEVMFPNVKIIRASGLPND